MAVVLESGMKNLQCAGEAIKEGYCYYNSSGMMTKITTVAQVIIGIAAESSIDDLGAAKTLTAGQTMPFFLPGCGKIVKMACITGVTWNIGEAVFGGQTADADGLCNNDASNSAVMIGHYFGPENVATSSNGDLIDVLLDCKIGEVGV
jgi:hypothetical protein